MTSKEELRIEHGTEGDVPVILRLIKALAEYEGLSEQVTATEEDLRSSLFREDRPAEVLLAYVGSEPVGFAVFSTSFSTFLGRPGLYLEDLFVVPEWRKRGYGRQLLERVANNAVQRRCGRMEWSVLDWNEPALTFYKSLGAEPMERWMVYRLTGAALQRLGSNMSI